MSKEGVALFRQCIHERFRLKSNKDGEWWLPWDDDKTKLKLIPPLGSSSELFCQLDERPFNFFGGSPPEHVAKMCDAIIALSYKGGLYIFLVEQKTSQEGDYIKQLENGKYFCDWLLVLLRKHGHYKDQDPVFIGLLCMRQELFFPSRGITVPLGIDKIEDPQPFYKLYKAIDRETVHLAALIGNA